MIYYRLYIIPLEKKASIFFINDMDPDILYVHFELDVCPIPCGVFFLKLPPFFEETFVVLLTNRPQPEKESKFCFRGF